jgi:sRNA-binding carbon storage regulator CsrA
VLKDLRNYAEKNGLSAIAAEAERALAVARKELAEQTVSENAAQDRTDKTNSAN